jgi:uncharacterized protein YggE
MKKQSMIALVVVAAALANEAAGQVATSSSTSGGISVAGNGEVIAKPDVIEVKLRVAGAAELTDDAIVKQRDARERVLKAFEGLKIENLKTEEGSVGIRPATSQEQAQMIMRGGMPSTTSTPAQVEVSSTVKVRVSGISQMQPDQVMKLIGRLLDTAKDSGAGVGPSPEEASMAYRYGRTVNPAMVRYIVTGAEKLREEGYQKAADDARKRADRLARLHNLKLGPVASVQEQVVSTDNQTRYQQPWETSQEPEPTRDEIITDNMNGAVFRVVLAVRYGIDRGDTPLAETAAQ